MSYRAMADDGAVSHPNRNRSPATHARAHSSRSKRRYGALRALKRDLSIPYQQTPGRGVYVGIRADPRSYRLSPGTGESEGRLVDSGLCSEGLPSELVEPPSRVRTDRDLLTETEAELLSYYGYSSLHTRLAVGAPELATTPSWTEQKYVQMSDDDKARYVAMLAKSAKFKMWRRAE